MSLGIWFHPEIYSRLPTSVPFAVRDPLSRGSKAKGLLDEWGAPNAEGYFRDDNTLVKNLPKSLRISSSSRLYDGRRMRSGFVASHLWRELSAGGLASRHPLTYSFVPNVVWLPSEVAKLTDREASFVQSFTQALAQDLSRSPRRPESGFNRRRRVGDASCPRLNPRARSAAGRIAQLLPARRGLDEKGDSTTSER